MHGPQLHHHTSMFPRGEKQFYTPIHHDILSLLLKIFISIINLTSLKIHHLTIHLISPKKKKKKGEDQV